MSYANLTSGNMVDLGQYMQLSTHFVGILDKESTIPSETRQLSSANITAINDAYALLVANISTILTSPGEPVK